MSSKDQNEALRGLVSAILVDLCGYITKLEAPIVVGGEYPPANALTIFDNYCYDRGIQINPPSTDVWEALYPSGRLANGEIKKPSKRLRFKNGS